MFSPKNHKNIEEFKVENLDLIRNTNPHPTTSTPYLSTKNKKRLSKKSSSPRDAARQILFDNNSPILIKNDSKNREAPRACSTPLSKVNESSNVRQKIEMFNYFGENSNIRNEHTLESINISKISSIHPNFTDEEDYPQLGSHSSESCTISFTDIIGGTASSKADSIVSKKLVVSAPNCLNQQLSIIDSRDLLTDDEDTELEAIFEQTEANVKCLTPLLLKKLSRETTEYRRKLIEIKTGKTSCSNNVPKSPFICESLNFRCPESEQNQMFDNTPVIERRRKPNKKCTPYPDFDETIEEDLSSSTNNNRKRPFYTKTDDHMITPEVKMKRTRGVNRRSDQSGTKKKTSLGPDGEMI